MSKVILVMDDPMRCANCPLVQRRMHTAKGEEYWVCGKTYKGEHGFNAYTRINIDWETRPNCCPLKPVPEKVRVFMDDWADGYNACLEDILEV